MEQYEGSDPDDDEDIYGDEEDKDYNEKGAKKSHKNEDDYGDSDDNNGYGLRHHRKR